MEIKTARFDRQYRTAASEGYNIYVETLRIGRLDLHFTGQSVHGTLVLFEDLPEPHILDLIGRADESLVLSAEVSRDDFYVTAIRGAEIGFYSDDFLAERGRSVAVRRDGDLDDAISSEIEDD